MGQSGYCPPAFEHLGRTAYAAAHRAGGWAWSDETKRQFTTDIGFPASHIGVGGEVNQDKGDKEPDRWKPPRTEAWCGYAVDWVLVKTRWELSYSTAEVAALRLFNRGGLPSSGHRRLDALDRRVEKLEYKIDNRFGWQTVFMAVLVRHGSRERNACVRIRCGCLTV